MPRLTSSRPSRCTVDPLPTETYGILGQYGTRCGMPLQGMHCVPAGKANHAYESADDKCANWKTMANDSNRYLGGASVIQQQ